MELDYKESWALKNWCFWTVVLEKTLESPLDCKKIQPVHSKGDQSWVFIGRTDAEAPILWPPDAKNWLIRKDPNAGKDWRQKGKRTTENEMVGWHHWFDRLEFEQALGVGNGQGVWCAAVHGVTKSQTWLSNWTELYGWELDHKQGWVPKNWCFWTVVSEKTLENPFDCKEIKLVNPKENQSWIFIGRTDAEPEAPILWPPDLKSWLTGKDPNAGEDWRQEKGKTEDEMVGWHHWLNGHELEQAPEDGEGQGSLACCSPRVCKESDMWHDWATNQQQQQIHFTRQKSEAQIGHITYLPAQWGKIKQIMSLV